MEKLITKTNFLQYKICPKDTWLQIHRPELLINSNLSPFDLSLIEQGNTVEEHTRKLFPGGVIVIGNGEAAASHTKELMERKTKAIFQATFIANGFLVRCDVLTYNDEIKSWDIHEVKGSNTELNKEVGEDYEIDLAFQYNVLETAGVKVGKCYLIQTNKNYVRFGSLDLDCLFLRSDVGDKVFEKSLEITPEMEGAKEYLLREAEPSGGCECHYNSRKHHCATFVYSHPGVPLYSVHDLARINKDKLEKLVDDEIYLIEDIPKSIKLSLIQEGQARTHRNKRPEIDVNEIRIKLDELVFPLYFLDYETFAPAVPELDGYKPYTRIPFQFSLHILRGPGKQLEHIEYLHMELSDPSRAVADMLEKHIEPIGTVIVWNEGFEKSVNRELAERNPEYGPLMERINSQVYDLMTIFSKQLYIHPGFHGSASIKNVLPVLAPELSYKDLDIHEGGQASSSWWEMVHDRDTAFVDDVSKNLLEYCKLDTYAMYAIWSHLQEL